jgi:hypothetical protein
VDRPHERKRSDAAVVSPFALQSALRANRQTPHNGLYKPVRVDSNLLGMRGSYGIQGEL